MIVLLFVPVLLLVMGIIILIGKGDNLIAGYNTAPKEERAEYDIKRLIFCSAAAGPLHVTPTPNPSPRGSGLVALLLRNILPR